MTNRRQERISELLHEELSLLISAELTDTRLDDALVTVTHVTVSADLHNARVYIQHVLPSESSRQVLAALRHADGFLRHALAENLNLRVVPELSFTIDESERRAAQIDSILETLATQPTAVTTATVEDDEHAD